MIAWCPHCAALDLETASPEVGVGWCSHWSPESVLRNTVAGWNYHCSVVWCWSDLVCKSWPGAVNCCSLVVRSSTDDEASSWAVAGACCTWWHWSGLDTGPGGESSIGTGHPPSCVTPVMMMMIAWHHLPLTLLTQGSTDRGRVVQQGLVGHVIIAWHWPGYSWIN